MARHRALKHGTRQPHPVFPFPADAAVTVGSGKTLFKFWSGWSPPGTRRLVAIRSGKKLTAEQERIRWDGTTFWARAGIAVPDLVYTDLQEG